MNIETDATPSPMNIHVCHKVQKDSSYIDSNTSTTDRARGDGGGTSETRVPLTKQHESWTYKVVLMQRCDTPL